jgi:hypothetical protein
MPILVVLLIVLRFMATDVRVILTVQINSVVGDRLEDVIGKLNKKNEEMKSEEESFRQKTSVSIGRQYQKMEEDRCGEGSGRR